MTKNKGLILLKSLFCNVYLKHSYKLSGIEDNTQYFKDRGFTFTINKFNLGYHQQGLNYLINNSDALLEKPNKLFESYQYFIPCYDETGICTNIITRINDKKSFPYWVKEKPPKNHNFKGYATSILNIGYLYKPTKIIFIVEGWADALSLEECGYSAIAINSTGNINLLLKHVKKNKDSLERGH